MTTTRTSTEATPVGGTGLKGNALGAGDLVFIVVSAAAPLMIMAGIAPYALLTGGLGAPTAYLFAGAVLATFAVGFTTMSRYVKGAGAFYGFVTQGLGKGPGVVAALLALLSYNVLQIGVYGLLGITAHFTFLDLWGIDLPWPVYAFAGITIVWYLGFRSVDFGAKVLAVMLTAETGLLLALAFVVLVKGGADGIAFDSLAPANIFTTGNASVLPFAFAAFMGFESTVIYRSETRDPARTIPRATYLAVAFLALVYAFIVWSIIQAFGAGHVLDAAAQDPVGLFFTATDKYLGSWAVTTMHLLIVTSIVAGLLAFHNAITRYTLAITKEGLLPGVLGRVHPRTRSPYVAGLSQTLLAAVIVGGFAIAKADPYSQLLIWVNTPGVLGILLLQVMVAISVPVYFRRTPNQEGAWRTVVAPLLSAVGMLVSLYLTIKHLSLLTAASASVNRVLVLTVVAVCLIGGGLAWWLRRTRPDVYASIASEAGAEVVDATAG
jgi:amino acid transporter